MGTLLKADDLTKGQFVAVHSLSPLARLCRESSDEQPGGSSWQAGKKSRDYQKQPRQQERYQENRQNYLHEGSAVDLAQAWGQPAQRVELPEVRQGVESHKSENASDCKR